MAKPVPRRSRPSRYKVPNSERVTLVVESDRFPGTLAVLSLTGGVLRPHKRYPRGTFAELSMHTVSGPITTAVELLSWRADGTQPFQFVHLETMDKKRLEKTLDKMSDQGLGDSRSPLQQVRKLARRFLPRSET